MNEAFNSESEFENEQIDSTGPNIIGNDSDFDVGG